MKRIIIVLAILLSLIMSLSADSMTRQSDLVSMREDIAFDQAIQVFNSYTKEYESKIIIDLSGYKGPIGIKVKRLHWKTAFNSILQYNGLQMTSKDKAYIITKTAEKVATEIEEVEVANNIKDEILIQVTFFEANSNALREVGVDWSTLSNGEVEVNSNLSTAGSVSEDIFKLAITKEVELGSSIVDINALFKAFESSGNGHFVSRPQITVLSGEKGFVHDGTSFSIKTTDEDGNTVDNFYDSGVIVTVEPETQSDKNGKKFIVLKVETESSSATPDAVSTIVTISEAKTTKYLYNGEEAVVGGVTVQKEEGVRKGIPILKDLPWWFFGLRYLAGYESTKVEKKELIILIKANIITDIHDRYEGRPDVKLDIENFRKGIPSIEKKLLDPQN